MGDTVHERCDVCGFDGSAYDNASLIETLSALGGLWRRLLVDAGADVRTRPAPEVWSAIEYAAHSRDITALHCFGVDQALTGTEPAYPAIMADDLIASAATTYQQEDPQLVADALGEEAGRLASMAAGAPTDAWEFGLTIGEDRSTVRGLLEHALHDSLHHIGDVESGLRLVRS
jgi:hypothetical protein